MPWGEDPANKHGAELYCRKPLEPRQLDALWEAIALGCIGEVIDGGDEVVGCRVVDKSKGGRTFYRLEIWLRRDNQDIAEDVKGALVRVLQDANLGRVAPNFDYRNHKGY